ncbi:FHA domain-containing protein [Kiritimatiellaeota bacterium B1221]|nr:FHA domain-containing protein [Kiritimatiellaeota bacterium B1221]
MIENNMMMIRIEILDGPEEGIAHSFQEPTLLLGSASDNHVRLTGEGILSLHARLTLVDGQGKLFQENESGGVKINGSPVQGESLLQPGDEIQLGEQSFRYKVIPFPRPVKERRIAILEWMTLGALIAGAFGQVFFLLGTARNLRSGVDVELLRATPTPRPTPNAEVIAPTPTPLPESVIILPTPIPTVVPVVEVTPTASPDADGKSASQLTSEARTANRNGEELKAERYLREALRLDAGYLPAKLELAKLLGGHAEFAESISILEQILKEAPAGSMTEREAKLELQIIRRRQKLLEETVPEVPKVIPTPRAPKILETPKPLATPQLVPEAASQVVVGKIRMERFPESPRYDAFRMVHFNLVHQRGTPAVEAGDIKVVVNFYEEEGGKVQQAQIPEPRILLSVPNGLGGGKSIQGLSAAYDVPKGKGRPGREYFGAVIQVLVEGKEVSRSADPVFLLDLMK